MKLFRHSNGMIISFGFDMMARKPNPRMICWCDPRDHSWEAALTNQAGCVVLDYNIFPEFVQERAPTGTVVAYQPGRCLEMYYTPGGPMIWTLRHLRADNG